MPGTRKASRWTYAFGLWVMEARDEAARRDPTEALSRRMTAELTVLEPAYLATHNEVPMRAVVHQALGENWQPIGRRAVMIAQELAKELK